MAETKNMILNMGPQHPSTHGVLRLILELDGETVVKLTPDIGYLHRGVEKLGENLTYHQFIPLTDREDYIASLSNNLAYCMTVEKLLGMEVPPGPWLPVYCLQSSRGSQAICSGLEPLA